MTRSGPRVVTVAFRAPGACRASRAAKAASLMLPIS